MKNNFLMFAIGVALIGLSACTSTDNPVSPDTPETPNTPDPPAVEALSIGVDINTDNPLACSIASIEGDTIHLFAEKDENGVPISLSEMLIQQADGNVSDIVFDEIGRPTYIEAPNGATFTLEWQSNTFASLEGIDPTTGDQINTYIDLAENSEEQPALTRGQLVNTLQRNGETKLTLTPIIDSQTTENSTRSLTRAASSSETIPIQLVLKECGSNVDYNCFVEVDYGGMLYAKCRGTKISTGVYQVNLPKSIFPEYAKEYENAGKGCEDFINSGIMSLLHKACWSDATWTGGVSLAVLMGIIKEKVAANLALSKGAPQVALAIAAYCGLIDQNKENLCKLFKEHKQWVMNQDLEDSYHVTLYSCIEKGLLGRKELDARKVDLRGIDFSQIVLDLGGIPSIKSFSLNPSAPMQGVSYVATAVLYCIPAGSTVYMEIIGTDNYFDSKTETISSTANNYNATLSVPGAAQGVKDVCKVVVTTPDGKPYQKTASLIFQ